MRIPFAVLFALAACVCVAADEKKKEDPEPAPKVVAPPKADIRGKVVDLTFVRGRVAVGSARVEGAKEKDTQYDKAMVRLTNTTKFYTWKGGKKVEAKVTDITANSVIQCDFTGPVAESYPVQATASEVLILTAAPAKK